MTVQISEFAVDFRAGAAAATRAAALAADEVDTAARFPHEAIDVLREARLLSCSIPVELGGLGTGIVEVAQVARMLGAACSSAGMVFAMHHSQAFTLGRHGNLGPVAELTAQVAHDEALLASATTEITTGGDVGTSTCAIQADAEMVVLEKNAPVISYARYADYILATARRGPQSPPSDQVLLVCPASDTTLVQTGTWDVLGFRGTCSPGFMLRTRTSRHHVLPVDYATISAATMLPASHTLWSAVWLGIADAAVAKARESTRAAARRASGQQVTQAAKLADLTSKHLQLEAVVHRQVRRFEEFLACGGQEPTVGFTLSMNNLKLIASTAVVEITSAALEIIGITGYRLDHPASMGRLLRDAFGPQLMVSNDRIRANNAVLALAHRGEGAEL